MSIPVILAHGSLGNYDELIFLGIGVIFIVMMGIAWVKARNAQFEYDEDDGELEDNATAAAESDSGDHFQLD